MTGLTSGLEDYIEEIYVAYLCNKPLKAAKLARKLDISRASVSEALAKLKNKGLINYVGYEPINLTENGIIAAKKVYEKHNTLTQFFEQVLGIDKLEASENACKIEHIVSQKILDRMTEFTEFCQNNKELLEGYKKKRMEQ